MHGDKQQAMWKPVSHTTHALSRHREDTYSNAVLLSPKRKIQKINNLKNIWNFQKILIPPST